MKQCHGALSLSWASIARNAICEGVSTIIPASCSHSCDAGHFCPDAVKAFDGTLDFPSVAGVAFDQKMFTTRYPFKHCTDKHVKAGSVIFRNDGKVAARLDGPFLLCAVHRGPLTLASSYCAKIREDFFGWNSFQRPLSDHYLTTLLFSGMQKNK